MPTLISKRKDGKQAKAIWIQSRGRVRTIQGDLMNVLVTLNDALGMLTA